MRRTFVGLLAILTVFSIVYLICLGSMQRELDSTPQQQPGNTTWYGSISAKSWPPKPQIQPYNHHHYKCVTNVSFIKIHKCGSGTFHNTLVNFAIKHNTTVALGNCQYYEMFPNVLSSELLFHPPEPFNGYNMFFDHVLFNATASASVLPQDTAYITQLRHPFAHGFSVYGFLMKEQTKGMNVPYATLLTDPVKHARLIRFGGPCKDVTDRPQIDASRNMMSLELGYLNQSETNLTRFREYLHQLDTQLTHVTILENLTQSLVLLKRKLGWSTEDLLHLRLHQISQGGPPQKYSNLSELHRRWSGLDYALYDFFVERHDREVSLQPADFAQEVAEHEIVQRNFTGFCSTLCDRLAALNSTKTPTNSTTNSISNSTMNSAKNSTVHITPNPPKFTFNSTPKHLTPLVVRSILTTTTHTFPASRFHPSFTVSYVDCVMHILDELETKKALIYHMYRETCRRGRGPRPPALQCDTKDHAIPGIAMKMIANLFKPKSCDRLKKMSKGS